MRYAYGAKEYYAYTQRKRETLQRRWQQVGYWQTVKGRIAAPVASKRSRYAATQENARRSRIAKARHTLTAVTCLGKATKNKAYGWRRCFSVRQQ